MTAGERGFLLLTSRLGDPERHVLTSAQLRTVTRRVRELPRREGDRKLTREDLAALGLEPALTERVLTLLDQELLVDGYLAWGKREGCVALTRASKAYPLRVRQCLGLDSPGCLWARGNLGLLDTPKIALAGSRVLLDKNRTFAEEAGRQAAKQGLTLVSGDARGADTAAQEACLAAGGRVIAVVADALNTHPRDARVLYLSEDSFDLPFSPQRALSRNRVIHSLGERTLVAQCALGEGGTWDGTAQNLRFGWSPVFCFADGSTAANALEEMGAILISIEELQNLHALPETAWGML